MHQKQMIKSHNKNLHYIVCDITKVLSMLSEELRTVAVKKSHVLHSAYMVLIQSRKCEKTLREAVIQKHKSNGNAVEVCLNHASHSGLLRRNTWGNKKLWVCNVSEFIQQLKPPLQQHSNSLSTMRYY
jgi:hypothetical protein